MSMADKLKQGVNRKKTDFSSESELRDLINNATSKSLRLFIQRLDAGEIELDNISDFIRVIGAYKEINGISEVMEGKGSSGQLPELNLKQDKVIEDTISKGKATTDEEGRINVMDMANEDVAELIRDLDIAQNKANEEAF